MFSPRAISLSWSAPGSPAPSPPPAWPGSPPYGAPPPTAWGPYPRAWEPPPPSYHKRQAWAAGLAIVALIIGIIAAFSPWYTTSTQGAAGGDGGEQLSVSANFVPGGSWSVTVSCSDCEGESIPQTTLLCPYAGGGLEDCPALPSTGSLFGELETLLAVGVVLALVGISLALLAALGFLRPRALFLGVVVLLLAGGALWIGASVALALEEPAAFQSDMQSLGSESTLFEDCPSSSQGPGSSFVGSCSNDVGDTSLSNQWGPSTGWYASLIGGGLLIVAGIVLLSTSKNRFVRTRPTLPGPSAYGAYPPYAPYAAPPIGPYPAYYPPGAGWSTAQGSPGSFGTFPSYPPYGSPIGGEHGGATGAAWGTSETRPCPSCGSVNPAGLRFCEQCGRVLETGAAP